MTAYVFRKNGDCGRMDIHGLPEGMTVEHAETAILEGLNRALTTHRDNPFTKVIIMGLQV